MSDLLSYLDSGLLEGGELRPELDGEAIAVAKAWLEVGVQPQVVELLSETLARIAAELDDDATVDPETIGEATEWLNLDPPVLRWLARALTSVFSRIHLAALAVHSLDVAEQMALTVYVAEMPALSTRSDRSGDAARKVGMARHLKG